MSPVAELAPVAEPRETTGVVHTKWSVSVFLAGRWRPGLALAWFHDEEGWRFLLDTDLDSIRIRSWYRFHPDLVRAVLPRKSRRRALGSEHRSEVTEQREVRSEERSDRRAERGGEAPLHNIVATVGQIRGRAPGYWVFAARCDTPPGRKIGTKRPRVWLTPVKQTRDSRRNGPCPTLAQGMR
jgi:hypothetical protein